MERFPAQAEVVEAAIKGDPQAFEALVTHHKTMIWSVCLRITGNTYDAEDALQDTLLAAWRNIGGFRAEAGFGTWIYRIASNAALGVIRKREIATAEIPEDLNVDRDFAEQLAASDLVQRALRTIPESYRAALVLRELCDFTYAQIAEHQGVGVPTVKSRISRARRALESAAVADGR
jgi:RNA polymerase sigma-70 factor (ECF subfamily)